MKPALTIFTALLLASIAALHGAELKLPTIGMIASSIARLCS